jgi:hypothetical protein
VWPFQLDQPNALRGSTDVFRRCLGDYAILGRSQVEDGKRNLTKFDGNVNFKYCLDPGSERVIGNLRNCRTMLGPQRRRGKPPEDERTLEHFRNEIEGYEAKQ